MNMVTTQGGGDSHLMGSPIQNGGTDTAGILGMVQAKMTGGRRRSRYRGGNMNPFSAITSAVSQTGGRRRSRKRRSVKKGGKRSGSKRRGSKRSGSKRRRTYRK